MIQVWDAAGTLREQWDDSTRTYTAWDASGTQTTQRPYTASENADADARAQQATDDANETTIKQRAQAALTANANFLALYASGGSPTNAQAVSYLQTVAKELNGLVRLALSLYNSTAGT